MGGEIIDLIRLDLPHHFSQRMLVEEIGRDDSDRIQQRLDPLVAVMAGPADHPKNLVALGEEELRQVRPILPRYPRN